MSKLYKKYSLVYLKIFNKHTLNKTSNVNRRLLTFNSGSGTEYRQKI
jgi:hypothetical protein